MLKNEPVDRRKALKTLGACAALPVLEHLGYHRLVPRQEGETSWSPRFFSSEENETVTVLSEFIIPETDTPGARAAKVNQYIDYVLSQASTSEQEAFRRGLSWLNSRSREVLGSNFIGLETAQQTSVLASLASPETESRQDRPGIAFFEDMKERTVTGYYSSEIGMRQELGFQGNTYLAVFEGCTHPEHLSWKPSSEKEGQESS